MMTGAGQTQKQLEMLARRNAGQRDGHHRQARLVIPLATSLLAPQIRRLLTLCAFINFNISFSHIAATEHRFLGIMTIHCFDSHWWHNIGKYAKLSQINTYSTWHTTENHWDNQSSNISISWLIEWFRLKAGWLSSTHISIVITTHLLDW